ncbi:Prefoldin [Ascodesmis nigricans]|uniref:Prefoldin n=1 Tax=Ascodesmis nigricans TaxID=341454 RepID=A0A4S2N2Z2_9PEZI|nr:Prefoldin [Ascodesmis nigricans]
MSIPAEALQKLMQEIESRANFSQQQLQIVKAQMAGKQRDIRLLQLTSKELETLPKGTSVYEGVGKMFVMEAMPDVQKRIESEEKGLQGDIKDLEKKFTYLETTLQKSQEHINRILNPQAAS